MIIPEKWAQAWIDAWNRRDLDGVLELYSESVTLRSQLAKLYAQNGLVRGKRDLRTYWAEVMRRAPNLRFTLIAVYPGHEAISFHYRDDSGRNCIETVVFDDRGKVISETACRDKLR